MSESKIAVYDRESGLKKGSSSFISRSALTLQANSEQPFKEYLEFKLGQNDQAMSNRDRDMACRKDGAIAIDLGERQYLMQHINYECWN